MPYLRCPGCRRTAWQETRGELAVECRHCGTPLDPIPAELAGAVRERAGRDARLTRDLPRFVRD